MFLFHFHCFHQRFILFLLLSFYFHIYFVFFFVICSSPPCSLIFHFSHKVLCIFVLHFHCFHQRYVPFLFFFFFFFHPLISISCSFSSSVTLTFHFSYKVLYIFVLHFHSLHQPFILFLLFPFIPHFYFVFLPFISYSFLPFLPLPTFYSHFSHFLSPFHCLRVPLGRASINQSQ